MADRTLETTIGKNVSKYREQANMTQSDLAEKVGVSTAFISRVERGQKMMKVHTLYATAQALNVRCDALLYQDRETTLLVCAYPAFAIVLLPLFRASLLHPQK